MGVEHRLRFCFLFGALSFLGALAPLLGLGPLCGLLVDLPQMLEFVI